MMRADHTCAQAGVPEGPSEGNVEENAAAAQAGPEGFGDLEEEMTEKEKEIQRLREAEKFIVKQVHLSFPERLLHVDVCAHWCIDKSVSLLCVVHRPGGRSAVCVGTSTTSRRKVRAVRG